ncbi:MAG: NAD-dependent epimerase/dehydratase [Parcubacteria group bacterium Athens0714_26]|nr:MAG: NAD-dependent epimerase/dehydratase [Parcubacteria group bacterium Athens0714_26]
MRIFITGGTGFIGKYVVEELARKNYDILILSRESNTELFRDFKNISFIKGDLSELHLFKNKLRKFKPEFAIHLAWEGIPDYGAETSLKNLMNSIALIMTLCELGCKRIVSVGSCWEYRGHTGKISEGVKLNVAAFNAFVAAKTSLYCFASEMIKKYNIQFIWVRPFFVYGLGQKKTSLIPYIINCFKNGKRPIINNLYGGNDFINVKDVANAMVAILDKNNFANKNSVYNIGSGHIVRIQEILKMIYDFYNLKFRIKKSHNKITHGEIYADISSIKRDVGWRPRISIKKGIKEMIEYYG